MFCGCCKLSNYHSYATHIDIFYPICFTWQKVRGVGNISAALGFLKPTAPWSSLRISCAAWHAAARLAARGRLLCSSVGPTRPPSPLSFSFVVVPMLKKYCSTTAKGGGSTAARPRRRAHSRCSLHSLLHLSPILISFDISAPPLVPFSGPGSMESGDRNRRRRGLIHKGFPNASSLCPLPAS